MFYAYRVCVCVHPDVSSPGNQRLSLPHWHLAEELNLVVLQDTTFFMICSLGKDMRVNGIIGNQTFLLKKDWSHPPAGNYVGLSSSQLWQSPNCSSLGAAKWHDKRKMLRADIPGPTLAVVRLHSFHRILLIFFSSFFPKSNTNFWMVKGNS